jgi:competence protein ComEA
MDKEMNLKRIALLLAAIFVPAGVALASVDVNTATKEELEAEGIGAVASQAVIDYRTRNGPFRSPEDVRRVISDAIAAKMHIGISISGPGKAKPVAPKEKSADVKPAPAPGADQGPDNVRERARKDQDDRKS